MIKSASVDDIAAYSCAAENVRMQTELELRGGDEKIEVGEDSVPEDMRRQDVTKGADVTFTVPFGKSVLKKPDAQWTFGGKRLENTDRISIATSRTHATVTIKHAEVHDCGTYTLKLSNAVSEVSVNFTLSIKGEATQETLLLHTCRATN